ncbi:hypothetical protein GF340_03535 [Candidatus Peregrinibacteria bacterium]|nr:hypothetical protein [Candidatus Peregrinibacteria bacterium]
MESLDFLYWSLGGAVILLAIFIVVAIYHLIRILKDVADTTSSVKETANVVNENIAKISTRVHEVTEHISDYVVRPIGMVGQVMEVLKPFLSMLGKNKKKKKQQEWYDEEEDFDEEYYEPFDEEIEIKPKGRKPRRRK